MFTRFHDINTNNYIYYIVLLYDSRLTYLLHKIQCVTAKGMCIFS